MALRESGRRFEGAVPAGSGALPSSAANVSTGGMSTKGTELLSQCVSRSMKRYFKDLNGEEPTNLYSMVMHEIERPLLEEVMQQAQSNQTRAAQMLGINRNTLRKKLKQYKLD